MNTIKKAFKGSAFHTKEYGKLEFLEDVLIKVDSNGIISEIVNKDNKNYEEELIYAKNNYEFVELSDGEYFLPGFVDLHVHAPQWPQAGMALDEPLNVWLDECTFPLEAKYSDINFAREVYTDLVTQYLARGTTTAMYFATIHNEASLELAKICAKLGQRGLVGKVVMDDPVMNPDFYRDKSTSEALDNTEKFILDVKKVAENCIQGVYPVITPRFVPSCTDEALLGLGKLAKKYNTYVQSHCSEGQWEHDFVKERFGKRDTEVLEKFGLLGKKSVMAHCNFLNEEDGEIFAKTGTAVGHCPISNSYFANAVLPVKRLKSQGVDIGLGTDISGGFSPSLYENIRHAVMVSRMLEDGVDAKKCSCERGVSNSRISVIEAFYLATTGGGESLQLPLGKIEKGYICDLQVIDTKAKNNILSDFGVFPKKEHLLQKIIYLATVENIKEVYVQGNLVHKK
ncbi:guanine deaminase [Gemelliphila palaticanis]|uniref:Guanine deaminase n=1 Tax=Gemelliphila palaticanis TaxID=81950 RepID=A0ABX2SXG1_9BACL|nr:guanine deaminase [Gemella palaticanis]MBF0714693.1 guanine deaminase [Gemella palaticanis]NYS46623.1 guanine deaminase [Gemella palaticanis]